MGAQRSSLFAALVLGLGMSADAAGQGLADAARKAQHGRKTVEAPAAPAKTIPVPAADRGDLEEPRLTMALFDRYALARETVGRTFAQDEKLRQRVEGRIGRLARGREAAAVYEAEPSLKTAIESQGFTSRTFMEVALTVFRASARAHLESNGAAPGPGRPGAPVLAVVANSTFAREHAQKIQSFEERLALSNIWWFPAPRGLPY